MRFASDRPVKILLLGAGGTGGYIAPHLYRLLHALPGKTRVIIADGDIVEERNLIRQNFAPCDIGENKAKVLAERYSATFGLEAEYMPIFIEDVEILQSLLTPKEQHYWQNGRLQTKILDLCVLIGAVDNNRSRQMCHKVFFASNDLVYIDSGNGEYTGQVVCGVRRGGKTCAQPVGAVYRDILTDGGDKFPTELSCAERSVSTPQSIAANLTAATIVTSILYQLLVAGDLNIRSATFSSKSMQVKSIA
jgi:PRTRC genetic system ThiF family protein